MRTKEQKRAGRPPASPERYSVRTDAAGSPSEELYIGTDQAKALAIAKNHHAQTGQRTWLWSIKTGNTILQFERVARAGAGR
jgi:hypothetical protein